ncbi:hypothetical protein I4U23_023747 [Adineta vaga]|nr:hypothetical protein I4U23_023747 [Adineta vaga]
MLWWYILFCIITIQKITHFVHSQTDTDNGEATTATPISTTKINDEQQRIPFHSLLISNLTARNDISNVSEQNIDTINSNEPSKQRIIVALAVLCAALFVLLGFLISIVVCQWLEHDKNANDLDVEKIKSQPNFIGSSDNHHEHAYRQTVKL